MSGVPRKNRVIKANHRSFAAKFNKKILDGLRKKLEDDPDADLVKLLPSDYSDRLQSHKRNSVQQPDKLQASFPDDDIRSRLSTADQCKIIVEPSAELRGLLSDECLACDNALLSRILKLLAKSDTVYKSAVTTVFKVSDRIAVKITNEKSAATEIGSLSYLQKYLPNIPAPKPHGLIQIRSFGLLFMTFFPGLSLETVWCQLKEDQKEDISAQIDKILSKLRLLQPPSGAPLGGVQGEGCKDTRRSLRVSKRPIMDVEQFEDFVFAGSKTASSEYKSFLRGLKPVSPPTCVFTHGDVRPANIIVRQTEGLSWSVEAMIDWEDSGFYPDYWECVKMTNNLTPRDTEDWYLHLPRSCSPRQYALQWSIDRILDRSLENS